MHPPHQRGLITQYDECSRRSLSVEGTLPDWLDGYYFQNGPGQFEIGGRPLTHWFDPLAMLRGFDIHDGEVTYTNRYVHSEDYRFAREHGRVRTPFPGTPPDRPLVTRLWQALSGTFPDNPIIGVMHMDDAFLAVTEGPSAISFDPATLETEGQVSLTDNLDCDLTLGHVHYDHVRETFIGLGVSYGRQSVYTLFERPKGTGASPARPRQRTRLIFDDPPYIHSFAVTDEYIVLPDTPFGIDISQLLRGAVTKRTFLDAFRSFDRDARFHVIDRASGERVSVVRADPFFVYHHANAYREADELVIDLVAFADERAVTNLTLANLRNPDPQLPRGDLVRYRLPLDGGRARRILLREGPVEFPVISYRRHNGSPYRYVYLAETYGTSGLPTCLTKVDVESENGATWSEPETYPGEAMFVPAPDGGGAEDEGILLSVVLGAEAKQSFLLCVDAATFTERARAWLPHWLPYGFHGQFYARENPVRTMA